METNCASTVYLENGVIQCLVAVEDDGQSERLYTAEDLQHPERLSSAARAALQALAPHPELAA